MSSQGDLSRSLRGGVAGARPAAACRFDSRERREEVGASDVVDVGCRPDGRPLREVPPLRLRPARESAERPRDLLQGARFAAAVLALPGSGGDLRRGASQLPHVRQPAAGASDAGAPLGRRRNRFAGLRPSRRRRCRAFRQATGRGALSRLGPVRRQRDGGRLDLGGARACRPLRTRQPRRDRRRQPARPTRRDDERVADRPLSRAGARVRLPCDRNRRTRRRRHRRRVRGGGRRSMGGRP